MANSDSAGLFMDTVHPDVIFVVKNQEIPAHRVILAKTCSYFDKLLFGHFRESNSKKVDITGVSAEVFEQVIQFIYIGQLEVNRFTIEDLASLLAVTHDYQFQSLLSAVIQAVEVQPLDCDLWPMVISAASANNSVELRRMCGSFAKEKIENFIREKDLGKFSADLICCMFDRPKMSSLNQDNVVKSICKWKDGRSSTEGMSVLEKINWENVPSTITAVVLRELLSTVKNVEKHTFWTKLSENLDGPTRGKALNDCISRVDSVVLKKDLKMKFPLPINKGHFCCRLDWDRLLFWFEKYDLYVDYPMKTIEFEASVKINIQKLFGVNLKGWTRDIVVSDSTSNNDWIKYKAVFPDKTRVYCINI